MKLTDTQKRAVGEIKKHGYASRMKSTTWYAGNYMIKRSMMNALVRAGVVKVTEHIATLTEGADDKS